MYSKFTSDPLRCFPTLCLLFLHSVAVLCQSPDVYTSGIDTVYLRNSGNHVYFSDSIFGIPHVHFLGKGMRCMDQDVFSRDSVSLASGSILSGFYEIPPMTDTYVYHTRAVLYNSFFEDAVIEADPKNDVWLLSREITYIPEGYVKYEVVYIGKQPFIIAKANVNGMLYVEWFRFGCAGQNPLYRAGRYASRGIGTGIRHAAHGIGTGGKHAARGIGTGGKHAARGIGTGLESTATSVGKSIYNESKMFYRPSREFEEMSPLVFEEKAIEVEDSIIIYTYFFRCSFPKANIFLLHGNGGNVSTYRNMIHTLVSGNYNVYAVDWRGYGRSTGSPEYKGVLKDTEAAFNDFISQTRQGSLKVIVYGMSLGGQIATKLTCDRPQDINALILDGSLSSAQNLAMDFMPAEFIRNNMRKNAELFNQDYVAERDIGTIMNMPKLIIHSETDEVVRLYHGERLYEQAREPKFFWKTNTRHLGTLEEQPEEAISRIDQLLLQTLSE